MGGVYIIKRIIYTHTHKKKNTRQDFSVVLDKASAKWINVYSCCISNVSQTIGLFYADNTAAMASRLGI